MKNKSSGDWPELPFFAEQPLHDRITSDLAKWTQVIESAGISEAVIMPPGSVSFHFHSNFCRFKNSLPTEQRSGL
jgi:hypothetical protein